MMGYNFAPLQPHHLQSTPLNRHISYYCYTYPHEKKVHLLTRRQLFICLNVVKSKLLISVGREIRGFVSDGARRYFASFVQVAISNDETAPCVDTTSLFEES